MGVMCACVWSVKSSTFDKLVSRTCQQPRAGKPHGPPKGKAALRCARPRISCRCLSRSAARPKSLRSQP